MSVHARVRKRARSCGSLSLYSLTHSPHAQRVCVVVGASQLGRWHHLVQIPLSAEISDAVRLQSSCGAHNHALQRTKPLHVSFVHGRLTSTGARRDSFSRSAVTYRRSHRRPAGRRAVTTSLAAASHHPQRPLQGKAARCTARWRPAPSPLASCCGCRCPSPSTADPHLLLPVCPAAAAAAARPARYERRRPPTVPRY